jgi:NAD(P)-dependent dehydrogenase (short-subunit alcohol dehydrogenase family)
MNPSQPEFDLTGKITLLTGAAGLIGTEVADAFAAYGATVVLTDVLPEDQMESRAVALSGKYPGAPVLGLKLDVTADASVSEVFTRIDGTFGHLDVLVNLAAIDAKLDAKAGEINPTRFENYPLELWQRSVDVNCTGLVRVTQAAARRMLARKSGNIVNVASTYSLVAPNQDLYKYPGESSQTFKPIDYVGTKSMVPNFTRYLATLYAGDGIRCNCIVPHGIDNRHPQNFRDNFARLSPMRRLCDVKELRGPFVFLASDASSYMTGAIVTVDGGWTAW